MTPDSITVRAPRYFRDYEWRRRRTAKSEATVQELADSMSAPHQKVSKHLGVLYGAGMVSRRREGATVRYSLVDWTGWWVVEQIARWVESSIQAQGEREAASER